MDENIGASDVCRLCLSKREKSLSIFGNGDSEEDSLLSRIRACVNVEVLRNDGLPTRICQLCNCHINLWYYFMQDCQKSQRRLKSWQGGVIMPLESHSEVNEVIHIKQEPQDDCDSYRAGDLSELAIESSQSPRSHSTDDGDNVEDEEEEMESDTNSMNIIILDATTITTDNIACRGGMGSTVIELQPEDEDLLRTVVESEEGLKNPQDDDDDVTIVQVGQNNLQDDIMEVLVEDSQHSSQIEEALESDIETAVSAVSAEPGYDSGKDPPEDCSVMLSRIKQEQEDWSQWVPSVPDKEADVPSKAKASVPLPAIPSKAVVHQCPRCPRVFASNKRKNIHLTKAHKGKEEAQNPSACPPRIVLPKIVNSCFDEETMTCKVCNKVYPNSLWHHMRRLHAELKPFACAVCRRIFTTKRELTAHRLRALSKSCRIGKATQCDPTKMYTLNVRVPKNTMGRYKCKECPLQFKSFANVKRHFTVHTGEMPYQCSKCKTEFREYKKANIHFKTCLAPLPQCKFECADTRTRTSGTGTATGTATATPATADSDSEYKNVPEHQCANCLKEFTCPASLTKHKKVDCARKHFCVLCTQIIDANHWELHKMNCQASDQKKKAKPGTHPIARISDLSAEEIIDIHKKGGNAAQNVECRLCHLNFSSPQSLRRHIVKHSGTTLKCNICNLTMQLESTLKSHMEAYHGGIVPGHAGNSQAIKTKNALVAKHKARLAPFAVSKLKCDQCLKLFSSMSALQFHKRTHVRKPNTTAKSEAGIKPTATKTNHTYVMCHLCNKLFHSRKALWQHKKIHSNVHIKMKIYKCPFCANSYSDAGALQRHKTSAHGEEEAAANAASTSTSGTVTKTDPDAAPAPFKCETCGKDFSSESFFLKHKKLHELPIDRKSKFKCGLCNKAFLNAISLISHKGWHSRGGAGKKTFLAATIHGKVKVAKTVKAAKPTKATKTSKYHCPVCGKVFIHKANVRRHIAMSHRSDADAIIKEDPDLNCKNCAESFPDVKALNKHVQQQHQNATVAAEAGGGTEEESFVCKLCKKTLKSRKGYKRHLLGHSTQKPYKCDICSNQYNTESALSKHKLSFHEFKPFACNKCKARFLEKGQLLTHYESCNV